MYRTRNINLLAILLALLIIVGVKVCIFIQNEKQEQKEIQRKSVLQVIAKQEKNKIVKEEQKAIPIWKIFIPKFNLEATIQEGVSQEVLKNYVGHFEETKKQYGNIGLAAHNRGDSSYFKDIKNLKPKDIIIYTYENKVNCYEVNLVTKIEETNWDYLQPTQEEKITLITCVENQPEYRICVQAIKKQ